MQSSIRKLWPLVFVASVVLGVHAKESSDARRGYSLEQTQAFAAATSYRELLGGGEVTAWWTKNIARTMRTAVLPSRLSANTFEHGPQEWASRLGQISAETALGTMTFNEVISDPRSGTRGVIILRRGEIVYETYPGMLPSDSHLWASVAKPTAALLVEQLIDEGKLRDSDTVAMHLPDFAGTALGETRIIELLDMTAGTDTHDTVATRHDPDSIATRYYLAEFGEAYKNGKLETVREVLKSAQRTGPPGEVFEYSSGITQMLVFVAEAITGQSWPDAFDERVWSHVRADGALQVHLAPDGMALAHGIVSSRLRDLARYGLLYTDYWPLIADRQVVSEAALKRIATPHHGQAMFLRGDGKRFSDYLGETPLGNSRQWDAVYADGGMFKAGLFGQGLYVVPSEGIVIAYYGMVDRSPLMRFLRPLARTLAESSEGATR